MARYLGPKCRYCRAEHQPLGLKGERCLSDKCPLRKQSGSAHSGLPGRDPKVRSKKPTDYGIQLREKQKLKRIYCMLEKQFKLTFKEAARLPGKTGDNMIKLLERRLDNVVYRLHFAQSRSQASQLVSHGHIFVNNKRLDIPSYLVKPGDEISIAPTSKKLTLVQSNLEPYSKNNNCEPWLSLDTTEMKGKFISVPERSDVRELEKINEQLIVELYSR